MHFKDFLLRFKADPFIDSRLFSFLNEPEQIIRNQINYWQKKGLIIPLKKGLYVFSDLYKDYPDTALIANNLMQPSYLSLEYALNYYNLIPEAVYSCTSVTTKKTTNYQNKLGVFQYKHITEKRYWGFIKNKNNILIAEPEKALLDYLYFNVSVKDICMDYFKEGMRLQNIEQLSLKKLDKYEKKFCAPKIELAIKELNKIWKKL